MLSLEKLYTDTTLHKPDFRDAAQRIQQNERPGDVILVDGPDPEKVFLHYYRGPNKVHDLRFLEGETGETVDAYLAEVTAEARANGNRIWELLYFHYPGPVQIWTATRAGATPATYHNDIQVTLYGLAPASMLDYPLNIYFGPALLLEQVEVDTIRPRAGSLLHMTTRWHTIEQAAEYKFSLRLWDSNGEAVIIQDYVPQIWQLTMHFWSKLLGQSEFALRLLSAMITILALPLLWSIQRALWPNDHALQWLTALLFITSPSLLLYSQEARMYPIMLCLALLSLYLCIKLPTDQRLSIRAGFILSNWLMVGYHYYSALLIMAQALFLFIMLLRLNFWNKFLGTLLFPIILSIVPGALWVGFSPGFQDTFSAVASSAGDLVWQGYLDQFWRELIFGNVRWLPEQSWYSYLLLPLHLREISGTDIVQRDDYPIGPLLPPTTWNPGDTKPGYRTLPLPAEGHYQLVVGAYDPTTGVAIPYTIVEQSHVEQSQGESIELFILAHLQIDAAGVRFSVRQP